MGIVGTQCHPARLVHARHGGFDAAAIAAAVNLPADTVVHAVIAIGKQGPADVLPEALQAREKPSPRHPLSALAFHGRF